MTSSVAVVLGLFMFLTEVKRGKSRCKKSSALRCFYMKEFSSWIGAGALKTGREICAIREFSVIGHQGGGEKLLARYYTW